jgi:hypothetical protein
MTFTAGSPAVVFHEEIKEAEPLQDAAPILVSQNFFRHSDRYRFENNERLDKFFSGSNTTSRVAEELGRRWLSIELDPRTPLASAKML